MPDRADVEQGLAALIASVLYPNGPTGEPVVGTVTKVYRGWPVAGALEADIAQGCAHVTVQPVAGAMRDRTRYPREWQGSAPAPTLNAVVEGNLVTFSGSGGIGHIAGIRVDGRSYAYRMQVGDDAALVAAALAMMIRADRPALASGQTVFVLNGRGMLARVVTDAPGATELRRQEALFRVTSWAPDPETRDALVGFIDGALAASTFIDIGGWACRLQITGDSSTDEGAGAGIWRRDLTYSVEYPTTANETLPTLLFGNTDVNGVDYVG